MRLDEEKSGEMTNSEGLPSKLPKAQRKQLQVELAPSSSNRAKQLKIADKICNVRDIAVSPPANWPLQRRRDYLEWAEKVVAGCRVVNDRLDQAFDQAIANARDALELKA
jgi:guanosine-3',5'-bis(diphosphate) 3'-pyrophosphohydrolase